MSTYKKLLPILVLSLFLGDAALMSGEKTESTAGDTQESKIQQHPKMGHHKKWGSAIDGYDTFKSIVEKTVDAARHKDYDTVFKQLAELKKVDTKNPALNGQLVAIAHTASLVTDKKLKDVKDIHPFVRTLKEQTWAFASLVRTQYGKDEGYFHTALFLKRHVFVKWLKDNGFLKKHKKGHKVQAGYKGKQSSVAKTTTASS
ncbi:MAG: hypothetical protein WCE21_05930 [Candidatus Babeliales bacterium]